MKFYPKMAVATAVVMLVGMWTALGNAAERTKRAEKAVKPELYTVVKVGDEVKVIRKSELTNLRKTTAEEDKKAKKKYDEDKKTAAKSKEKTDLGKPPVKRFVKVLKDMLKSQEDAKTWIEEHPQDKDKDGSAKTAKKTVAW